MIVILMPNLKTGVQLIKLVSKVQNLIFSPLSLDSRKEPTHILDKSRSCIDLIFTSQPNIVIDSGVHASLHSNCHHQIIYAKFDLKIFYPATM